MIEPHNCSASFRQKNSGYFFKTLETVGHIAPSVENPEWSIQIPVPQNSRINMLSNGFCAYLTRRKKRFSAEVFSPEPGVLWGRHIGIPLPLLIAESAIETDHGSQWIEHDDSPALLAFLDDCFCLITKERIRDKAVQLAESYLKRDIEEHLQHEYERRSGAEVFFEQMSHHDSLAAISTECMMRALRPAEANIPFAWSQSPESNVPALNVNELHPLALAWRHINPQIAEELVLCVLKLQYSSGAIPVHTSPHGNHTALEAPRPLLAKTTEIIWETRKDPDFLATAIPPLRRHLQWLLHHFDPKRRGVYCWQNSNEPLSPEIYESELSSVDLAVLLLTEIEALNRLREHSPTHVEQPPYFPEERENLARNLLDQFWNNETSMFSNAFVREKIIAIDGIPAFTPLLWNALPAPQRQAILEKLKDSGSLPGGHSVLSWHKSSLSDQSFPLLQQLLMLQALNTSDPQGTLVHDFSRVTLQGFIEWHSLSLERHQALQINPLIASFIMNVQSFHHYRDHANGRFSGALFQWFRKAKVDQFEILVGVATLLALLCMHTVYKLRETPPELPQLELQMNSAHAAGNIRATLDYSLQIIRHYPQKASMARYLAGNILLIQNHPEEAGELLAELRKTYPDSPGAMIALGLSYQMQGRFEEAEKNYAEFCYLFDEIFPEEVAMINHFRLLLREGFLKPPKWSEIYRYPLMNEL
jgi:tetratricopeptide (TPR) repeat protein